MRRLSVAAFFSLSVLPFIVIAIAFPTSHLWLPDDAYYYFEIARNIADGYGSTFDRINPTNGYHPLWEFVLVFVALTVTSPDAFATVVIVLQSVLVCYVWTLTYSLLFPLPERRTLLPAALITILLTWNYYIAKTTINGLESALFVAAAITFLWSAVRVWSGRTALTWVRAGVLGLTAACVILARLDGIFFVAGILLTWLMIGQPRPSAIWRRFAVITVVPFFALAVYMWVNWRFFGLWMPVSGFVKRMVWTTGPSTVSILAYFAFAAVLIGSLRAALGAWPRTASTPAIGTAVGLSVVLAIYQADAWLVRGQLFMEVWYLSQHLLWVFVIALLVVVRLALSARRWGYALALAVGTIVGVVGIWMSWTIRLERVAQDHPRAVREVADWINANLPENAILAGWDVGQLAFYAKPRVVNLDGLVNSPEYVGYLRTNRVIEFMDKCGVEYVVQYFKPTFHPFGLRVDEFWDRVSDVVWRREIEFAPMSSLFETGRRKIERYPLEVRAFRRTAGGQE